MRQTIFVLFAILSPGCAGSASSVRPDCGVPCCVSAVDGTDDEASMPCDGRVLDDPSLGPACERESGVVEACAGR